MTLLQLAIRREESLARAALELKGGRLVVVPTDTVYGLAADAFNAFATAMVFQVKRRPRSMPLPVLVGHAREAWALAERVPEAATLLADRFWPGALTLVLPEQESMIWDLGETGGKVAVRMPDQPELLDLLRRTGPLAVTSANITGEPTPRTAAEIASTLGHGVSLYLDGGPSPREIGSSILDLTGDKSVLVREGAIAKAALEEALGRPLG